MTDFTTRNPGIPPTRNKPGNLGAQAAAKGAKSGSASPARPSRGGVTSPSRLTVPGGGDRAAASPPAKPETSDFKHAIVAAQYQNMRQLGRDIPFGVWLVRNGHHRELVDRPFDLFLDA